ncbi:MAG TPA: MmcQ/YjbR family DNA-binding protein [Mucilaginibacter sp.]|nr:MmcQ/YjbR family DNA-binding protein [Mucilaginibacter sp.]
MSDPFIFLQFIRNILLALPGVTESPSHGTPAFYVQKKFLARLWENGEVLVVRTDERDKWLQKDPEVFFMTDHYRNYPTVLVNLAKADPEVLKRLLTEAWMARASQTQIKDYQSGF